MLHVRLNILLLLLMLHRLLLVLLMHRLLHGHKLKLGLLLQWLLILLLRELRLLLLELLLLQYWLLECQRSISIGLNRHRYRNSHSRRTIWTANHRARDRTDRNTKATATIVASNLIAWNRLQWSIFACHCD